MGTGNKFVSFKNKMLLGFEDMGDRMLNYLKTLNIESVQARWDVDGAFNAKLTLAGSAANTLQVGGTSKGTDGLGHILDVNNIFDRDTLFENTNAVTYYVAMFYAEVPEGIRINPRTGAPQYDHYVEQIGKAAAPTSVVDNGNGTITFNVNSVTESGVTNAGRKVRVFLNTPAAGSTTEAIAIEELTVAFGGGNNTVVTAGALGQTTISTTASDYTVVLMGASVARNTILSTINGAFFLGTVTGNGGTPATFDTSGQGLLKTFQDATQVTYSPTLWLVPGPLTVQQAIDNLMTGLLANGAGEANGAQRVGVNPNAYTMMFPDPSQSPGVLTGGIGNLTEGTMTADESVGDAFANVDTQLQAVRTFTTHSHGYRGADAVNSAFADAIIGLFPTTYYMRQLAAPTTDQYELTGDGSLTANTSIYVLGESASSSSTNLRLRPRITFNRDGGFSAINPGKWQRVYIDAPSTNVASINSPGQGSGGIFEDCLFHGGRIAFEAMDTASGAILPFDVRNSVFDPGSDTTHSQACTIVTAGYSSQPMHGMVQNSVILGLPPGVTSPSPVSDFIWVSTIGSSGIETAPFDRPMKFSNCLFISQRVGIPSVILNSKHKIVFENCHFFGISGQTAAQMIQLTAGANAIFRDCVFYGKEGAILNADLCYGLFDNCTFITGSGGTAITHPKIITANGGAGRPLGFRNCTVLVNTSAIRDSGTSALITFGSLSSFVGVVEVNGLYIKYTGGSYIHPAETLFLIGSACANFKNITIDGNGLSYNSSTGQQNSQIPGATSTAAGIAGLYLIGASLPGIVDTLTVGNLGQANAGVLSGDVDVLAYRCSLRNITTGKIASGTDQQLCELYLFGGCTLDGFQTTTATTYAKAIILTDGTRNVMRNIRLGTEATPLTVGSPTSGTIPFGIWNSSSESTLDGFQIFTQGSGWNFEITNDDRDFSILNGRIISTSASRTNGCIDSGTARGILISNISGIWDSTTKNFIFLHSNDSAVDNVVLYHSAGATAAVNNTGTGNTVGTVINRAAL